MNIAIVGPGAIGGLFGCRFADAGHRVTMVDHQPERATRLQNDGLMLDDENGVRSIRVSAVSDPRDALPAELVCICVKAYDTHNAVRRSAELLASARAVVSLQNGLGNAQAIHAVGANRAVCATTALGAALETGRIRLTGEGDTWIAPFLPSCEDAARFVFQVMQDAIGRCLYSGDSDSILWGKLIINAAINPITAIEGVPNGAILEREDLKTLLVSAARESESVARAADIRLPYDSAETKALEVCAQTALNRSSMLRDVDAGRRTEIEAINGKIIDLAERLDVAVPINRMLMDQINRR